VIRYCQIAIFQGFGGAANGPDLTPATADSGGIKPSSETPCEYAMIRHC
jgi:hypothetical protein